MGAPQSGHARSSVTGGPTPCLSQHFLHFSPLPHGHILHVRPRPRLGERGNITSYNNFHRVPYTTASAAKRSRTCRRAWPGPGRVRSPSTASLTQPSGTDRALRRPCAGCGRAGPSNGAFPWARSAWTRPGLPGAASTSVLASLVPRGQVGRLGRHERPQLGGLECRPTRAAWARYSGRWTGRTILQSRPSGARWGS